MIDENVRNKIGSLIPRGTRFLAASVHERDGAFFGRCNGWITEALNVVEFAIPDERNAYRRRFVDRVGGAGSTLERVAAGVSILQALLPDIDAGLLGNLGDRIRAETFDDFLDHAVAYVERGREKEAGVIAGVVFEDTLRRTYASRIRDPKGKPLEDIINDLARQGTITGQQSKMAKVGAHVRTKATHAQRDEFDLEGVKSTIQITRQFLGQLGA
jgi:hypothetical protein